MVNFAYQNSVHFPPAASNGIESQTSYPTDQSSIPLPSNGDYIGPEIDVTPGFVYQPTSWFQALHHYVSYHPMGPHHQYNPQATSGSISYVPPQDFTRLNDSGTDGQTTKPTSQCQQKRRSDSNAGREMDSPQGQRPRKKKRKSRVKGRTAADLQWIGFEHLPKADSNSSAQDISWLHSQQSTVSHISVEDDLQHDEADHFDNRDVFSLATNALLLSPACSSNAASESTLYSVDSHEYTSGDIFQADDFRYMQPQNGGDIAFAQSLLEYTRAHYRSLVSLSPPKSSHLESYAKQYSEIQARLDEVWPSLGTGTPPVKLRALGPVFGGMDHW